MPSLILPFLGHKTSSSPRTALSEPARLSQIHFVCSLWQPSPPGLVSAQAPVQQRFTPPSQAHIRRQTWFVPLQASHATEAAPARRPEALRTAHSARVIPASLSDGWAGVAMISMFPAEAGHHLRSCPFYPCETLLAANEAADIITPSPKRRGAPSLRAIHRRKTATVKFLSICRSISASRGVVVPRRCPLRMIHPAGFTSEALLVSTAPATRAVDVPSARRLTKTQASCRTPWTVLWTAYYSMYVLRRRNTTGLQLGLRVSSACLCVFLRYSTRRFVRLLGCTVDPPDARCAISLSGRGSPNEADSTITRSCTLNGTTASSLRLIDLCVHLVLA